MFRTQATHNKILVADDCNFNIDALKCQLTHFNISADAARDGLIALDKVKNRIENNIEMYELIMLDYSMPELDGPSTAKKIHELLTSKHIKMPLICCITAFGDDAHR